jgi:hypothetical protein
MLQHLRQRLQDLVLAIARLLGHWVALFSLVRLL